MSERKHVTCGKVGYRGTNRHCHICMHGPHELTCRDISACCPAVCLDNWVHPPPPRRRLSAANGRAFLYGRLLRTHACAPFRPLPTHAPVKCHSGGHDREQHSVKHCMHVRARDLSHHWLGTFTGQGCAANVHSMASTRKFASDGLGAKASTSPRRAASHRIANSLSTECLTSRIDANSEADMSAFPS